MSVALFGVDPARTVSVGRLREFIVQQVPQSKFDGPIQVFKAPYLADSLEVCRYYKWTAPRDYTEVPFANIKTAQWNVVDITTNAKKPTSEVTYRTFVQLLQALDNLRDCNLLVISCGCTVSLGAIESASSGLSETEHNPAYVSEPMFKAAVQNLLRAASDSGGKGIANLLQTLLSLKYESNFETIFMRAKDNFKPQFWIPSEGGAFDCVCDETAFINTYPALRQFTSSEVRTMLFERVGTWQIWLCKVSKATLVKEFTTDTKAAMLKTIESATVGH